MSLAYSKQTPDNDAEIHPCWESMQLRDEIVLHRSAERKESARRRFVCFLWQMKAQLCQLCVSFLSELIPFCTSLCVTGQGFAQERIVGGYAPVPHSIRYIVSLQTTNRQHFCGGFLINRFWVVTAAHCNIG